MIRATSHARAWLLSAALILVLAAAVPTACAAQTPLACKCEKGTIDVGETDCSFKMIIEDAKGTRTLFLTAGSTTTFTCSEKIVISLVDCEGNRVDVHSASSPCVECVCMRRDCCVDACVDRTAEGCLHVKVVPSVCKTC